MYPSRFIRSMRARLNVLISSTFILASIALPPVYAAEGTVPYVPTPQVVVDRMLELAHVGPQDYLIDLGSGDGRIVVTAAKKYGTRGFGVDLNPTRIAEANANARAANVTDKVSFYQLNLFETDLSPATVITMYLLPQVNLELRPKILDLKPGTRIVSHDFSMGDWKPEMHEELEAKDKYGGAGGRSDIYLWIVPAKVAGTWQSQLQVRGKPVTYEIMLEQEFQNIGGTVRVGGRTAKVQNAKVLGDQLSFDLAMDVNGAPLTHHFSGTVHAGEIAGTAEISGAQVQARLEWNATRSARTATLSERTATGVMP